MFMVSITFLILSMRIIEPIYIINNKKKIEELYKDIIYVKKLHQTGGYNYKINQYLIFIIFFANLVFLGSGFFCIIFFYSSYKLEKNRYYKLKKKYRLLWSDTYISNKKGNNLHQMNAWRKKLELQKFNSYKKDFKNKTLESLDSYKKKKKSSLLNYKNLNMKKITEEEDSVEKEVF